MRPVDADALLKAIDEERQYLLARGQTGAEHILVHNFRNLVEDAPSIPLPDFKDGYRQAIIDGQTNYSRPTGEWIIVKDEKWGDNVKCPFCGKELAGTDLNFCCKCGAKLTGSAKMNGGAE